MWVNFMTGNQESTRLWQTLIFWSIFAAVFLVIWVSSFTIFIFFAKGFESVWAVRIAVLLATVSAVLAVAVLRKAGSFITKSEPKTLNGQSVSD